MANRSLAITLCLGTAIVTGCGAGVGPSATLSTAPTAPPSAAPTADPTDAPPSAIPTATPTPAPDVPDPVDIEEAGALAIPATQNVDWTVLVDGEAWVAGLGDGIGVLDASGTLTRSVAVTGWCESMEVGFGRVWSASCDPPGLIRINAATGEVDRMEIQDPIVDSEASVGAGDDAVWFVAGVAADQLYGIDPTTLDVQHQYEIPAQSAGVRAGFGAIWVTRPNDDEVLRIDPATGEVVATIPMGNAPRFLAVGAGGVWVLNAVDGTVSHVDPGTNTVVATIGLGWQVEGGDIAVGGGSVWVRGGPELLARIDPATDTVTERYGPRAGSGSVAADDDAVWATAHDVATIWRLPLR